MEEGGYKQTRAPLSLFPPSLEAGAREALEHVQNVARKRRGRGGAGSGRRPLPPGTCGGFPFLGGGARRGAAGRPLGGFLSFES